MPPERPDRDPALVLDIDRAAERAIEFVFGMTRKQFHSDLKTQAAVIHQIIIVGEAVKRLSIPFREANASVPWKKIARMRDIVIHHYNRVNVGEVWKVVSTDLPVLRAALAPLRPPDAPGS